MGQALRSCIPLMVVKPGNRQRSRCPSQGKSPSSTHSTAGSLLLCDLWMEQQNRSAYSVRRTAERPGRMYPLHFFPTRLLQADYLMEGRKQGCAFWIARRGG